MLHLLALQEDTNMSITNRYFIRTDLLVFYRISYFKIIVQLVYHIQIENLH